LRDEHGTDAVEQGARPTTSARTDIVLKIIKGVLRMDDACSQHGVAREEIESWVQEFVRAGRDILAGGARGRHTECEAKFKELQAKIGELVVERDALRDRLESTMLGTAATHESQDGSALSGVGQVGDSHGRHTSPHDTPPPSETAFRDLSRSEKQARVRAALRKYGSARRAAEALGISHQTVYNHLVRGDA